MADSPKTPAGKAWNTTSVAYNIIGISIGVILCGLGLVRSFQLIDNVWFQWQGDVQAKVISVDRSPKASMTEYFHTTFQIPAQKNRKAFQITIDDKKLFTFMNRRFSPASNNTYTASLVKRMLSRRHYLAKVGPIRLGRKPKSAELIVYLGIIVIGGAVAFTAFRDLQKRWLRRGITV
ncbi:MAG: hypothetical protein EP343_10185 [Deltaproteobacteria bacterium]|nr:MAG: hypothetical protein EP343_10185 [Deltaproteobacteria bacterium]